MTHFKMKLVLILIFLAVVQGFDLKSTYQSFCTLIYRKPCQELTKEQQQLIVCSLIPHNPDDIQEYFREVFGQNLLVHPWWDEHLNLHFQPYYVNCPRGRRVKSAMVQGFDPASTYQSFCTLIYQKPCKELTKEQQKLIVTSLMKHNPDEHLEYYTEVLGKDNDPHREQKQRWWDEHSKSHPLTRSYLDDVGQKLNCAFGWKDDVHYRCPDGRGVQKMSDCYRQTVQYQFL